MFSLRNIFNNRHFMGYHYEFEDVIQAIDSVDLISPTRKNWFNLGRSIAYRIGEVSRIAFNPGVQVVRPKGDYELFMAICQFPIELYMIKAVKGWKDCCRKSVCLISEFVVENIRFYKGAINVLSEFDHVLVNFSGSVDFLNDALGDKCMYLPIGADALLFCPYPDQLKRVVDVYSIGHRAEKTHKALLKLAREKGIFYLYDSINDYHVYDLAEHRFQFVNIAKRSRYFLVNPALKTDATEETITQSEIGTRYYEGAASGSILIGEIPTTNEYKKSFFWQDAVVELPFGSDKIDLIIEELDRDRQRRETIRRNNIVQSLRNHDWLYRWEAILGLAELSPMPELNERKERLMALAEVCENEKSNLE
jgi:hypothetical protein